MKKFGVLKLLSLVLFCLNFFAVDVHAEDGSKFKYYYEQLRTEEARGIYHTLEDMLANGDLKEGTVTVDLVEKGILENTAYDRDVLMADFISARDAFMFDYNVFYVDFDKLSLSLIQDGTDYRINMGIGREKVYLADGFETDTVSDAIAAFESKADAIAAKASEKEELDEQIRVAYEEVMNSVTYALEADAKSENVLYVRNSYGALVRGQAVCEGYARALKTVLDKLGIDSVLVQGMYVDEQDFNENGSTLEPHMWNYVKMDDNRWYMLDATMGDGEGSDADDYFLKYGTEEAVKYYQPDGVISLSGVSLEFAYPSLSGSVYQRMSLAFTYEVQPDGTRHISYNGKGLAKAEQDGQYIVASFDGTNWYYLENYTIWMSTLQQTQTKIQDFDTYFVDIPGLSFAYYAVTDTPEPVGENSADYNDLTFITCVGAVYDQSKVGEAIELKKSAPVAVTKIPANSRLDGDTTYDVVVTYSEPLMQANAVQQVGMRGTDAISEGSNYTNFTWDRNNPKVISFTFTTSSSYNYSTGYYFEFINLVGKESLLAPKPVGFHVVNTPVFGCPKASDAIHKVYANTPALIADSNLAECGWLDENKNPIGQNLPSRLALVAAPISGEDAKEYEDKIEGNVVGAQTYDLSLTLCGGEVSYITGRRVKVYVPFPAGLNAESGVTFKAYHFDKDGNPEEVDCITTEHGIIMMCNAFSAYTVVGVEGETSAEKQTVVTTFGQGGVYLPEETDTLEFVKLVESASQDVVIKAENGYKIEAITLNEDIIVVENDREMTLTLSYAELLDAGNVLEVSFVTLTAADEGGTPVYSAPVVKEGLVYNAESQTLLIAGTVEHGTMLYSLDGTNWSENVPAAKDAGNYEVQYKIEGDVNYDSVAPQKLHVSIDPAVLTVALSGETVKGYDGNNMVSDLSILAFRLSGKYGTDIVNVVTTNSYALYEDEVVGEDKKITAYNLMLDNSNYVLDSNDATANIGTIHPRVIQVTMGGIASKVYDGTTAADISGLEFYLSEVIAGDAVQLKTDFSEAVYCSAVVGTQKEVVVEGLILDNNNYILESDRVVGNVGIVTKAELTITSNSHVLEEGSEIPEFSAHYFGFVGGEDEAVLTGSLSFICDYTKESAAGQYDIIPTGVTSDNYEIIFEKGILTVSAKELPNNPGNPNNPENVGNVNNSADGNTAANQGKTDSTIAIPSTGDKSGILVWVLLMMVVLTGGCLTRRKILRNFLTMKGEVIGDKIIRL